MLKLLEAPQPQPPRPSDHAPLKYQFERLYKIAKEIASLAVAHYESLPEKFRKLPLEVDWEKCLAADLHGLVHVMTVRTAEGKLVGYCINSIIQPFMHANTHWALLEAIYLAEEYREGWTGYIMFQKNTKAMKMLGCDVIKSFCPVGSFEKILERLGYEALEIGYFKYL